MKLSSKVLAGLVVVLMFGGILISSAVGWWQTTSTKQAAAYTSGEFAGQANPADIRGSYTFGDVEKNFKIPAALVAQAFGVTASDPATFAVKELEGLYADSPQEIGTASVRLFVAFYLGLPIDLSAGTYVPEAAAAILRTRNLSADYAAYLEQHVAPNLGGGAAQPAVTAKPAAAEATPAAAKATPQPAATSATKGTPQPGETPQVTVGEIKGKTTFADLLAWGLNAKAIEAAIGKPMPAAPGMTVKDFCTANNLDFEVIRPAIQAELDKLK